MSPYSTLFIYFISITIGDPITKSDLQLLAQTIDGDIEFPDESSECLLSDKMTFTPWTCPYTNSFAIILPETTDDVSLTIAFITDYDTPFRIKSGGNSFGGYSKCEQCININLERMNDIEYETGSTINDEFDASLIDDDIYLIFEAGTISNDIVESFTSNSSYNRRIPHPAGSGISSGFFQCGGVAESVRIDGYASDYIVGVEIVLYDGTVKTILDDLQDLSENQGNDECEYEKDILWAIRGSGGGSFGVITKFYMRTIELEAPENIFLVYINYNLVDVESGVLIMRACQNFSQIADISYKIDCGIELVGPSSTTPTGYIINAAVKYFGEETDEANDTIHDMLLNPILQPYVSSKTLLYPPNEYVVGVMTYDSTDERAGYLNGRLIESYDLLTDEFYEAYIGFYVNTIGVLDGSRCICGSGECTQCIPGVNDYLTCCGVGGRSIFFFYGDSVYNGDPNNCYTSAPNRNYVARTTLIVGTAEPEYFEGLKDTVVTPLLQQGIDDVLDPYLGDQNYVCYRDSIDTTLDSYFGAGNEDILSELKRIKCIYDPYDVFNHSLSIPAENCDTSPVSTEGESDSACKHTLSLYGILVIFTYFMAVIVSSI